MRVNQHWKKFIAVGCSHGNWADPSALDAVEKFISIYKPETRIHLGDYTDSTPWRAGASYKDHKESIQADLEAGVSFLERFEPTLLFNGNHDIRIWDHLDHVDSFKRDVASTVVKQIEALVRKFRCEFVQDYVIDRSYRDIGDTKFLHGFVYNENAIRAHAQQFGKCVIAHLHKVGMATASRIDSPAGYCVGYLGDRAKFTYADRRPATFQWSQGFAFGEYSDHECKIYLEERNKEGGWKLPV